MESLKQAIQNYFQKTLNSEVQYQEPVDSMIMDDIQAIFTQLQVSTAIQDLMSIGLLLNLTEATQDSPDEIESRVLAQYILETERTSKKSS